MSYKYRIINTQEFNEYIPNCPVKILKTQIIEDSNKQRYIQFKFKNLIKAKIKSIYISVIPYDDSNEELEKENYDFLDITLNPLDYYKVNEGNTINSKSYTVKVIINKVVYGKQVWKNNNIKVQEIKINNKIEQIFNQVIEQEWNSTFPCVCTPKEYKNYWQCACSQYNDQTKTYCGNCGIDKQEVFDIFNKKKALEYQKNKKHQEEIEDLKEMLKKDEKDRQRAKANKLGNLIGIIAITSLIIIIICFIIISTKDNKKYVMKYCNTSNFKIVTFNELKNNYSCGSLAMYIKNNNLSEKEINELINLNNFEIYKDFKKIKNKELLEYLNETDNIYYLEYLHNSTNYTPKIEIFNNLLNKLFEDEKYDDWEKVVKLLAKYNYEWNDVGEYFDGSKYNEQSKEEKYKNIEQFSKYSRYYHLNSNNYSKCYTSDLYDAKMVKELVDTGNYEGMYKICTYAVTTNIEYISLEALKNYVNSGADLEFEIYSGTVMHSITNGFTMSRMDSTELDAKLQILENAKADINKKMSKDSANPGFTPLDVLLWSSTKNGNSIKNYRVLKKHGAVCNKNCNYEKKYIEAEKYEY